MTRFGVGKTFERILGYHFFLMIGKLSSGLRGLFSKRKISMLVVEVII
jgi:hypothetical protein